MIELESYLKEQGFIEQQTVVIRKAKLPRKLKKKYKKENIIVMDILSQ